MDQIWWNHIIKAHAFLENVVKEAAEGTAYCWPFRIRYHGKVHFWI